MWDVVSVYEKKRNTKKVEEEKNLTNMQVTFIEQKGECIISYFGRPCDEFAE